MLLVIEWLKEFIDIEEGVQSVSDLLTMAGLEIEGISESPAGTVLNVNVTPNRGDCLSVLGIARELKAITGRPLKAITHSLATDLPDMHVTIDIADPMLCHRYAGQVVTGVRIGQSPQWLRQRLEAAGVRSINNVVDATNYVMLERGQPLHAFDLATLTDNEIRIKATLEKALFVTLDGVKREIPPGALFIWDRERPVALAGIMGGQDTGVTESTSELFLECASFNPLSIRKTSRTTGLRSESSYRFERGIDTEAVADNLGRLTSLILDLCGGKASNVLDVYPQRHKPSEIKISVDRVRTLIGADVEKKTVTSILSNLGFLISENSEALTVTPPSYRKDVETEADIVEEVARLYGYDKIPSRMPALSVAINARNEKSGKLAQLKTLLRSYGFTETINYSFISEESLDVLNLPGHDERRRAVRIKNPIRSDQSIMRTFMIPALVKNFLYNVSHGIKTINIYETGTVFTENNELNVMEYLKLGAISYDGEAGKLWRNPAEPFYRIKGVLQAMFDSLGINSCVFKASREPFLAEGRSIDAFLDGQCVGFAGLLCPEIIKRIDLKSSKTEVAVMELNLDMTLGAQTRPLIFRPLPRYPSIERDVSIIVDADVTSQHITTVLRSYPDDLLESVELFDQYKGKNIPADKKSLTYRIVYRSMHRTLTDDEIDTLYGNVINYLKEKTGAVLRDF